MSMTGKELKRVRVGDREYPCILTMGAAKTFKDRTGLEADPSAWPKDNVLYLMCILLFGCLCSGCARLGEEFPFREPDDMLDFIDLVDMPGIMTAIFGLSTEKEPDGDTKKKPST